MITPGPRPHLVIQLFGRLQVTLDGEPVTFRYDKVRALLAYLAVEATPQPREALLGLLWPEAAEADARRNLSQALYNLRQVLGEGPAVPAPKTPFVLASRETLQFNPASDHQLDVADFQTLLADCAAHGHGAGLPCPACAERLQRAAGLYCGDFLQHFFVPDSAAFEEWALLRREDLRRQALGALAQLTAYSEQAADYEQAREYARRQLALEPWREEAHRDLMRLLARDGQRSAALAQYEAARKVLAEELGVGPAPETGALLAQIRAGEWEGQRAQAAPSPAALAGAGAAAPKGNLPIPLTAFVGREHELVDIRRLLAEPDCRLLTLAGPGGIGKTRLAIQAAAAQLGEFPQGAAWVALASAANHDQMLSAIGTALGLAFSGAAEPGVQVQRYLKDKALLLVLDNFEHLLAEAASTAWLGDVLRGAPALKLLVTSRESLDLQGEWVLAVEGLGDEAVELFVQSARRARAGFELREAEAASVRRICELVGAMPLGVELAAAWVRVLSCAEIVEEIERAFASRHPLDFFASAARDVPERHRSLAAVFDHSWRLLSAGEQAVLGRLAVFRGGFGRAAAEQVAGASLAVLSALSAKSLLRRLSAGRYDLHGLVRQYAADQLARSPADLAQAHNRHCAYYAAFLSERADALRGSHQHEAASDVAGELDNIRAAWQWAIEQRLLAELRQMAMPVYLYSQRRSDYRHGAALLTQAIACVEAETMPEARAAEADFRLGRGWLNIRLGRLDAAEADFERSQTLFDQEQRLPQYRMVGDPVMALGIIASIRGDYAAATRRYQAALELVKVHGDAQALAYPYLYLGSVQRALGDYAAAERYAQQAHTLARSANQSWQLGFVLNELGQIALARGDYAAAQDRFEAAYALREKLSDASGMALDLSHQGQVALARQALAEAERLFQRSLALYRDIGDQGGLVTALHGLGRTAAATGRPVEAWGHLVEALEIAHQASFVPVSLSLLTSIAELLAEQGAHARARRLVGVVLAQPNHDQATCDRAEQLLARLGGQAAPAGEDLASLVASVLADPLYPAS